MRSELEIRELLEEVEDVYKEYESSDKKWDELTKEMKSLHNFYVITIDVLDWVLGGITTADLVDSIAASELLEALEDAGLLYGKDAKELTEKIITSTGDGLRSEHNIRDVLEYTMLATGLNFGGEAWTKCEEEVMVGEMLHKQDNCCDAADVLQWVLGEIGDEFKEGDYLDLEGFREII